MEQSGVPTSIAARAAFDAGETGEPEVVEADSAIVLYLGGVEDSERVPYVKGPDRLHHPASLTKLMTALLAVGTVDDLNHPVQVTPEDLREGSGNHMRASDELSLDDALHSLLIPSSNTAAEAIARTVGHLTSATGDPRTTFLRLMKETAKDLGMATTPFTNPSGLHDPAMVTSARHPSTAR